MNLIKSEWTPPVVASLIFIFFQLQIYNLGIQFRDEGFLYLNALRILSGEVPYRDFFMTTMPGSFYLAALYVKFFGLQVIYGRLLYFIFVIFCIFIIDKIYQFKSSNRYVLLVSIAIFFLGIGSYAYYNLESLTFILAAFYFLNFGILKKQIKMVFFSGLLVGISFLFKQSFGAWAGIAFAAVIFLEAVGPKLSLRLYLGSFAVGFGMVLLPFILYFYLNNALDDLIYYAAIFSREVKAHRNPFIFKSIVLVPLIYVGIKVLFSKRVSKAIVRNSDKLLIFAGIVVGLMLDKLIDYLDISRFYYALFIVFPVFILAFIKKGYLVRASAILFLALFFANASSGRELGTLMWLSPIYVPLIIYLYEYFAKKSKYKTLISGIAFFLIIFQAVYFSAKSLQPTGYANGVYKKEELRYQLNNTLYRGIAVSSDVKKELDDLIPKLKNMSEGKSVLCFPYCPLMNVLVGRPSPSYFNFFYPEAFLDSDQSKVIEELRSNNSVIVIQKKGRIEPEALYEDQRFGGLKKFIVKNYLKRIETENFAVYTEK